MVHHTQGNAPGIDTPTSANGLTTPHSQPAESYTLNTNGLDYPTGHRTGKASAALKAKFARAGHLVHDGGNEDYIVVKADWCMSRHCPNYAALVSFGRILGVA